MYGNKSRKMQFTRIWTVCCTMIFLATLILTIGITYYLSEHYLQGDISSDLVYANHLYRTGRLVSDEWYGSTEFKILRAEWIFAPLFALFEDWHMVRFAGTMIMQGLIILSFGYLLRQIQVDRNSFFLGASVLLVPYCFAYGVNVLYGCSYATFVSISFFSVALFVSLLREKRRFCAGKILLLCLLGFASSLGGPRVLLNIVAPVFLLILYMNAFENNVLEDSARRIMRQGLVIGAAYALCALAGYVTMTQYLAERFAFKTDSLELKFGFFNQLDTIVKDFMYAFGYQDWLPLMHVRGIVALAGAGVCLLFLGWGVWICRHWQEGDSTSDGLRMAFVSMFGFFALLVMLALKALTTDNHYNETYYLLIGMWAMPLAALLLGRMNSRRVKAAAASVLLILYMSGLVNTLSFIFPQRYKQNESATFHHMELPRQIKASCDFLEERGLTFGYATFWYANVITEMTDGKIRVAGTKLADEEDALMSRYYWLTSEDVIDHVGERAFMLLSIEEEQALSQREAMSAVQRVYGDEYFAVYEILDPQNVYHGMIL